MIGENLPFRLSTVLNRAIVPLALVGLGLWWAGLAVWYFFDALT